MKAADRAGGEPAVCPNGFLDPEVMVEAGEGQAGGSAMVCVLGHL